MYKRVKLVFFTQVTLKNTDHCVSTDLSVFDCALFVQVIHEVVTQIHETVTPSFAIWFYVLVTRSH